MADQTWESSLDSLKTSNWYPGVPGSHGSSALTLICAFQPREIHNGFRRQEPKEIHRPSLNVKPQILLSL